MMRKDIFFRYLLSPSKTDPLCSLKLSKEKTITALELAISKAYSSPLKKPRKREETFDRAAPLSI